MTSRHQLRQLAHWSRLPCRHHSVGCREYRQSYATEASRPDLLVIHSLTDQCNPIRNDVKLYDDIHQPNKWFPRATHRHHLPRSMAPTCPLQGGGCNVNSVPTAVASRRAAFDQSPCLRNEQPSIARMYSNGLGPTLNNPRDWCRAASELTLLPLLVGEDLAKRFVHEDPAPPRDFLGPSGSGRATDQLVAGNELSHSERTRRATLRTPPINRRIDQDPQVRVVAEAFHCSTRESSMRSHNHCS